MGRVVHSLMLRRSMREHETIALPDGRQLGYADYGDPAGQPVFLFHGWPSSRLQGAYLHESAMTLGIRVVTPDRPGVGLSDPLPGRRFSDWPIDVAHLADALGIHRFSLFGVSGGGPYTLATCAALGDRLKRAAVVCGAPPLAKPSDRAHLHWAYRSLSGLKSLRRAAVPAILPLSRWMIHRGSHRAPMAWLLKSVPARDREALQQSQSWDKATRSFLMGIANGPRAVLTEGELYLAPWDFRLEDIQVPVRFWHGLHDANLPCEIAQRLAAQVPNSEGRWVEGEGHYSLAVHHSDEVLDWLTA